MIAPVQQIETYRTLESLSFRLREARNEQALSILLASSREELLSILALRDAFHGVPIMLVVPDQDHETLTIAHKLHPRFLTYKDDDFTDLGAVLAKKLNSHGRAGSEPQRKQA